MDIGNIWPNGFEQTRPDNTRNNSVDSADKEKAIELLKKGEKVQTIADMLDIKYQTVAGWKSGLSKVRY